jgi:hypothetical protein
VGLYVSTTGTDVAIPELGISLTHPSTDYPLSEQFSPEDLQGATTLTTVVRTGTLLTWKKTADGTVQTPTDYDPDLIEADNLNLGPGAQNDRLVSFKDLTAYVPPKSGIVSSGSFTGTPRIAAVTFVTAFPDNNYTVVLSGADKRSWSSENKSASGFTISSNASQALTGNVYWMAEYQTNN